MLNRRLMAAAALSLGFHAVLLTAAGFAIGRGTEPPPGQAGYSATLVRLTSPSKSPQAIAEPVHEPEETPYSLPETTSTDAPEPLPDTAPRMESLNELREADAEPAAEPAVTGNTADTSYAGGTTRSGGAISPAAVRDPVQQGNSGGSETRKPILVSTVSPVYPILARRLGVEGVVVLDVLVDSRGVPIECVVIPPRVHKVLEESALSAVMRARFQPGLNGGRPIQDTYRLKVRFELET